MEDRRLIREYLGGSEEAFTELVNRHLGLVYATALRRLGARHAAEEVTQTVFTLLARKASTLRPEVILAGWLYQTTCHRAARHERAEQRRLLREQQAAAMQLTDSPSEMETAWNQIEPLLDNALRDLGESDRAAILLRFFQRKRLREVGDALGVEEEAARKRVDRALARLHAWFSARGVAYPVAFLAAILMERAGQTAPAMLAAAVSDAALKAVAAGAGTAGAATAVLKIFTAMKLKTSLVVAGVLLLLGLVSIQVYQERARVPATNDTSPTAASPPAAAAPPIRSPFWHRVSAIHESRQAQIEADPTLRDALARLKAALHGPPVEGGPANDPARGILSAIPLEQRFAALEMIDAALGDPNKHVALRAIQLIPLIWPQGEAALPSLFELVRTKSDKWPDLASAALMAAAQVRSDASLVPELVAAAMHGPASARKALVSQLPLLKSQINESGPAFAASLEPYLFSPAAEERFSAAQALAQLPGPKDPAVVNELAAALAITNATPAASEKIRSSLAALFKMGPDAQGAIPALLALGERDDAALDAVNVVLKAIAPEALEGIGVFTPLPPLDPVAAGLARQIEEGAIPVEGLGAALENPKTAPYAARALAEFGPAAKAALPALQRAFNAAVETNLSSALVLGAAMERLDPSAPKPLLLANDVLPALEAVYSEAQKSSRPAWNEALRTLSERVPVGMAFRHEDIRLLAAELGRINPVLREAFVGKLLATDRRFETLLEDSP